MERKNPSFIDFLKPYKLRYAASIILALFEVFCGLVPYIIAYHLFTQLFINRAEVVEIAITAALILCFLLLQILFHNLSTAISHKTAFRIIKNIKVAVTKKMLIMPIGHTQAMGNGYFKHLIMDDIERLEYPLAHALPETTSNTLLPLSIIIVMFVMDYRMGFAALIPAAATLIFYLPMYKGIMDEFAQTYNATLREMNSRVIEYIRGIKEIKIFGRKKDAYSKYEQSINEYRDSTLRLYNKMYFVTSPAYVLLTSILVSILCTGGILYSSGRLELNVFLVSIFISTGIGGHLLKFTEFMDNFYTIKNGKNLVNEVLSAPELQTTEDKSSEISGYDIEFDNVTFSYKDENAVSNVSVKIREGEKTAIVGPSGSGKSTIANLIVRFWDITDGQIKLGNVNIKNIPLEKLMDKITYVTQDTFLFNISVKDNIRIGNENATDEEIINASKSARCHEFITDFPNGYETVVGDEGTKLSGGQRQRIIIARAILKNAPVLILDEATAYTDMENQLKLQESIEALTKGKTLITIAHRLPTIKNFDKIIVINKGRIDSTGTHEKLLENSLLYKKMWEIHNRSFDNISGDEESSHVV